MSVNASAIEVWAEGTTVPQVSVGHRVELGDARVFYYGFVATAVGRGKMAVAADTIANHNNLSFAVAPAVGDQSVTVTLGGTAATADQYKDGWLVVQDGTGEGRAYPIEGHGAQATTTGDLVVFLKEQIDTAGALAESNVDLIYNAYDELRIDADQGQTDLPVGVPIGLGGLGSSEYGYVQTWGPCAVWRDASETLGENMTLGGTTGTGQVEPFNSIEEPLLGIGGPAVGVADEYQLMYLRISR